MLKNKEVWEHTKVYVKEVYLQRIIKSNLSNGATKLLLVLQGHKNSETGLCNPSQELLAKECNGVSVRTIQRWLKELKEKAFIDRKSTRLNSSHANISYAVFCLKKKK